MFSIHLKSDKFSVQRKQVNINNCKLEDIVFLKTTSV